MQFILVMAQFSAAIMLVFNINFEDRFW